MHEDGDGQYNVHCSGELFGEQHASTDAKHFLKLPNADSRHRKIQCTSQHLALAICLFRTFNLHCLAFSIQRERD